MIMNCTCRLQKHSNCTACLFSSSSRFSYCFVFLILNTKYSAQSYELLCCFRVYGWHTPRFVCMRVVFFFLCVCDLSWTYFHKQECPGFVVSWFYGKLYIISVTFIKNSMGILIISYVSFLSYSFQSYMLSKDSSKSAFNDISHE
jgi:hypothetical protein